MSIDIALDLGTATTQVVDSRRGLIIDEPTVAAIETRTGELLDIGRAGLALAQQSPDAVLAVWPLQHGVVDDDETLQRFIGRLIRPLRGGFMERMRLVIAVPTAASPIERRTLKEAARRAGASQVYLVEQSIAAALGGDLPVHEPIGSMVVNAGAGITEAGLLSLGSVVASASVRAGGTDLDDDITNVLRRDYGVVIDERTAEMIKVTVAANDAGALVEAPGQLLLDGSSVTAILEHDDVDRLISRHHDRAVEAVHDTLVQAPPELAHDVLTRGIHLGGGSAVLAGLAERLAEEFAAPVHLFDDPAHVVARGAGKCAEAIDLLKPLFAGERPR